MLKRSICQHRSKQYSLLSIFPFSRWSAEKRRRDKVEQQQTICKTLSHFPQVNHYSISRKSFAQAELPLFSLDFKFIVRYRGQKIDLGQVETVRLRNQSTSKILSCSKEFFPFFICALCGGKTEGAKPVIIFLSLAFWIQLEQHEKLNLTECKIHQKIERSCRASSAVDVKAEEEWREELIYFRSARLLFAFMRNCEGQIERNQTKRIATERT